MVDKDKENNELNDMKKPDDITDDAVKVNVIEGEAWKRTLNIEVSADEVNSKFESVFNEYRTNSKIAGFRPGKAPMAVVKKKYAKDIMSDVFEPLVSSAYEKALVANKLWPLGNPEISDVDFDENKPLKFKAEIEIRPEIELKKHKGFRIEKNIKKVTDKDLEESINYLRENMAEFNSVERVATTGDLVIADLNKKFDKLENVEIMLGAKGVLKEFQDGITGMNIGEMKDIEVKYPQDYYDKNLAGNEIIYTALVKEVKEKVLPELNEELIQKISKYKTVDEFNTGLRENLEKQAQSDAVRQLRSDIIKNTVESNTFEVPASLLNRYLDSVVEDYKNKSEQVDEEEIRKQYKLQGENLIRWNFLYHEIAHAEKINVSKEDRAKWVHDFSVANNMSVEQARESLGKANKLQDIDESILEGKVLEFAIENSEIIENEK